MGSPLFGSGVAVPYSNLRSLLEPLSDPAPLTLSQIGLTGQTANISSTLLYTAPADAHTSLYRVSAYIVSTNTPTGATLPGVNILFTDNSSGASETMSVVSSQSTSALGTIGKGEVVVSLSPATNINYSTGSYGAGSGTALQYALHIRIAAI